MYHEGIIETKAEVLNNRKSDLVTCWNLCRTGTVPFSSHCLPFDCVQRQRLSRVQSWPASC